MWSQASTYVLCLNVLILIVQVAGFIKITKNDLCHVQKSLDEIKYEVKRCGIDIGTLAQRVSNIEGKLDK